MLWCSHCSCCCCRPLLEIAAGAGGGGVGFDDLPHLGDARAGHGRGEQHRHGLPRGRGRKQVQRALVIDAGAAGGLLVAVVGFGDAQGIGHFHDAALHALQLVAGPGQHQQQEKIDHAVHGGFGLPHAHGFDDNDVVARRFAQQQGLAGGAGHAAQAAAGRRRPDEGRRLSREPGHAGFIAQNAAAAALATGVHGQHGQLQAFFFNQNAAQRLNKGAFAHARHARDAHAQAPRRCAAAGRAAPPGPGPGRLGRVLSTSVMARPSTVREPARMPAA